MPLLSSSQRIKSHINEESSSNSKSSRQCTIRQELSWGFIFNLKHFLLLRLSVRLGNCNRTTDIIHTGFDQDSNSSNTVADPPTSITTLPLVPSGSGCFVKKVWSLTVSPFSETVFSYDNTAFRKVICKRNALVLTSLYIISFEQCQK